MDDVPTQPPARRNRGNKRQYARQVPHGFMSNPATSRSSRWRRNNNARVQCVPPALRAQAAELRFARVNLERAYTQERNVNELSARIVGITFEFPDISAARARAERRYVNCLVRYLRDTHRMDSI